MLPARSLTPNNVSFTMSTELPTRIQSNLRGANVTIVAASYNAKYTNALVENCLAEFEAAAPYVQVNVVRVPGAFEVPVMVKRAIADVENPPDTVIAFGVILRGSTAHADLIGTAVTNKLLDIACDTLTPVVHEVLLLDNEEQAFARCVAASLNRGREAARTAIAMLELVEKQTGLSRIVQRQRKIALTGSLL